MAATPSLAAKRNSRRRGSASVRRRTVAFYVFIGPWLAGFVLLGVIPLVIGFATSLTNYDGLNLPVIKVVGLRNYARAFSDPDTSYAFGRTLLWSGLNTPTWLALSFLLALILHQKVRGRELFRTLFYLPSVVPAVAAVWIWKIFLDGNFGLLNAVISLFRPGTAIHWLGRYALQGLTLVAVWGGLGGGMIIFLAGLQDIPTELEEAARIDGANSLGVFRHVTLPLMTPVVFFQLVLGLISSFQQLALPLLLAPSSGSALAAPPRATYLYVLHVYQQIFVYSRFGYGTALLWLLFVVITAITVGVFRSARYWVYYEVPVEGGGR